jgi:hypothetical protein
VILSKKYEMKIRRRRRRRRRDKTAQQDNQNVLPIKYRYLRRHSYLASTSVGPDDNASHPLYIQVLYILKKKLVAILPEIVIYQASSIRLKVHKLLALDPLRPIRVLPIDTTIWIQVVEKVDVIGADTAAGIIGQDSEKDLYDIRCVKGTENGRPEVVGSEV